MIRNRSWSGLLASFCLAWQCCSPSSISCTLSALADVWPVEGVSRRKQAHSRLRWLIARFNQGRQAASLCEMGLFITII